MSPFAKTNAQTAAIRPERSGCVGMVREQANHPTVNRGRGMR